jgi:hypothetical protein
MKLKKNIAISDSGFIFDPASGNSFTTNPIGLEIIDLLKKGGREKEIIEKITQGYEVDPSAFEKDLYDFVNVLVKLKLIEEHEARKD